MNLIDSLEKIDRAMPGPDKEFFTKIDKSRFPEYHFTFGRWIRNHCDLWRRGTGGFQHDLKKIREAGYEPWSVKALMERKLTEDMSGLDASIDHPDNASHIIMDIYHDLCNYEITKEQLREWISGEKADAAS